MPKSESELAVKQAWDQIIDAEAALTLARQALDLGRYHQAAQLLSSKLTDGAIYNAEGARNICASLAEQKRTEDNRSAA